MTETTTTTETTPATPATTFTREVEVRAWTLGKVETRFKRLAKRAAKLGVAAPTFSIVEGSTRETRWKDEHGRPQTEVYVTLSITGEAPVVEGGWVFIGLVEHTAAGNLIKTIPGLSAEGEFIALREAKNTCDHCGHNRKRKMTFLVRDAEGLVKRVGKTCLKDYTGNDPMEAARYTVCLLSNMDEEGNLIRHNRPTVGTVGFIAWSFALAREYGYMTRGKARDAGCPATADMAWLAIFATGAPETNAKGEPIAPSGEDHDEAARMLGIAREVLTAKASAKRSDYEHNLLVAITEDWVSAKQIGFAASVIGFVQRYEARKAEDAVRAEASTSEHVGEAGDRLDAIVTVTGTFLREGFYGATTLVKLITETGSRLTWWASGERKIKVGGRFIATFTVKKHGEYKGVKDTTVSRVELSEDIAAFEKATAHECPHCKAAVGAWCKTPKGSRNSKLHGKRTKLSK